MINLMAAGAQGSWAHDGAHSEAGERCVLVLSGHPPFSVFSLEMQAARWCHPPQVFQQVILLGNSLTDRPQVALVF